MSRADAEWEPTRFAAADVLRSAVARVVSAPRLAAPFFLAGFVVALADLVRRYDPIPSTEPSWLRETLSVQYSLFPQGGARTLRELGALVDLRLPYLLGAVALELAVPLAVGVAGWLTITRCLDTDRVAGSLGRYAVAVTLLVWVPIAFPLRYQFDALPLALLALVALSLVAVRLFLLPGFLAAGHSPVSALRASVRASCGIRRSLFGLILAFGLASWALASVPLVGGFLSTALVGSVQAVSIGLVVSARRGA